MAISDKSRACQRLDNKKSGYRCLIINVHEIENILPLNYIDNLISKDKRYKWDMCQLFKRHFDYLSRSERSEDILPYFDYNNSSLKN